MPARQLPADAKLLRDRKNKAPSQANRRVMYLRMVFDWAMEEHEGWVKADPAGGFLAEPDFTGRAQNDADVWGLCR